jgi:hypothetical protein
MPRRRSLLELAARAGETAVVCICGSALFVVVLAAALAGLTISELVGPLAWVLEHFLGPTA